MNATDSPPLSFTRSMDWKSVLLLPMYMVQSRSMLVCLRMSSRLYALRLDVIAPTDSISVWQAVPGISSSRILSMVRMISTSWPSSSMGTLSLYSVFGTFRDAISWATSLSLLASVRPRLVVSISISVQDIPTSGASRASITGIRVWS